MTLQELLTSAYEDTNYQPVPSADVRNRFVRYLNEGMRSILAEPGLERLVDSDSPFPVVSVVGQSRYVVPEAVGRIVQVSERTNDYALAILPLSEYRRMDPDPASHSGTPTHVVPIGKVAVAVQPSDASEIFVKSTSGSDVQTCFIEGIITGGYRQVASVTMTGTTAVSLNAALTSFIEIEDFYLSLPAVGTVTLHEDSGSGTELARIAAGDDRPSYLGFYLWPTPSAAITYLVDYRRGHRDLVNDSDAPPLLPDFHPMLVKYATWREWERKDDVPKAVQAKGQYDTWLRNLKWAVTQPSPLLVMGRMPRRGHSRLGAYFPADRFWN